jgi:hypothetical protein
MWLLGGVSRTSQKKHVLRDFSQQDHLAYELRETISGGTICEIHAQCLGGRPGEFQFKLHRTTDGPVKLSRWENGHLLESRAFRVLAKPPSRRRKADRLRRESRQQKRSTRPPPDLLMMEGTKFDSPE